MDDIDATLCDLISRILARPAKVEPETALFHDLGIAGDDAAELLEAVHERFSTSFDGFRFSDYFVDETEALGAHWFSPTNATQRHG